MNLRWASVQQCPLSACQAGDVVRRAECVRLGTAARRAPARARNGSARIPRDARGRADAPRRAFARARNAERDPGDFGRGSATVAMLQVSSADDRATAYLVGMWV